MSLIENKSQRVLDEQIQKAIAKVSSELLVKASLGSVASNMSFDPDAQDGDGDGMVQDGSPFERPAVIGAVSNASQRLGKLLAKASRVNTQGRAREYHRRYSGMSAQDIARDAVPDSFEGWVALTYERMRVANPELPELSGDLTPSQRKELVRQLEDFVENDLVWMLSPEKANRFSQTKKRDRDKAFRELLDGAFDFSPEAVAKQRELVEHVLTTNPQFRAMVDKFGLPAIVRFGENMDSTHMAAGMFSDRLGISLRKFRAPRSKGRLEPLTRGLGKWFMSGIIENDVGSRRTKRWVSSDTPEALLVHEYGHYLADVVGMQLTDLDKSERTKRWQAWRFSAGSTWKDTFREIGHEGWYDEYAIQTLKETDKVKITKTRKDIPDEIPHVLTAYGESSPAEAFAEAIAATFTHEGRDADLVSGGMRELINDMLELPQGKSPRESLTPQRARREVLPDGFASRGSVAVINNERDPRFGELTDPYELAAEWLGTLDQDDPVGEMTRRITRWKSRPKVWDRLNDIERRRLEENANIREANEEEAVLIVQTLMDNPAFADMIRRHGIANMYFSERDLKLVRNDGTELDVRGAAMGSFTPDDSDDGRYWPARIVMDLVGQPEHRTTLDAPTAPLPPEKLREWKAKKIPGNVTRSHVSNGDQAVIRHEGGHSIHDMLWEKVHRGEIRGRRANLIRAYASSTWEEFYTEIGRPDLWEEHQRALRATHSSGPGSKVPSQDIQQIDSAYAWSNPREFFAEAFTAYTSSNPEMRALMNDTALEHMQAILGDADTPGDQGIAPNVPEVRESLDRAAFEGFASIGDGPAPKSYNELRTDRIKSGKGTFSRTELFRNTTTEQKVDLAIPDNERDYMLMAWDHAFERMGFSFDEVSKIDLGDPANPKVPRRWAEALEGLEQIAKILGSDMPDFSPEMVRTNREALTAALDAFPRMRDAAERFGLPPITVMTQAAEEHLAKKYLVSQLIKEFRQGNTSAQPGLLDLMTDFMAPGFDLRTDMDQPRFAILRDYFKALEDDGTMAKVMAGMAGGYSPASESISINAAKAKTFMSGIRHNPGFIPEKGSFSVGGEAYEDTLLHEFAHHIDIKMLKRDMSAARAGDTEAMKRLNERRRLAEDLDNHIATRYGQSSEREFFAEAIAAVLSGNRDSESMLSQDASRLARSIAGLPERDPVFAGRTNTPKAGEVIVDRFGSRWNRTPEGEWTNVDNLGSRSREGVPDVLETMVDAKRRTGLRSFDDVEFDHDGRRFVMRQVGDTFEIDINGRTVASASVVEGSDGLPEINNVDVLPGYDGIAPDADLHEMVVDHARKRYPSARTPQRARKAPINTEGFASVGPEHYDARQIDGTPGTPEYAKAVAGEFENARVAGKKVFFDYNGETREVEVTEVFEKNGIMYMKGNDALRNGEERMFRLDRVSMPKRVQNPETGADEIAKKPGKPPRKPVPVFTGKAAEIFEGAKSWEEVAARLGKGRYVFFDFETTGIESDEFGDMLHPGTPTQIGLIEIVDGKVTRRWSTHVNPGRPMPVDPETGRSWSADNLKYKDPVTGELKNISDEWLATQKPLGEALEEMLEFIGPIGDTILGGQNHPYDDDVMKRAMADAGLDPARWNPGGFIDSQALAQALLDKSSDDYPKNEKGAKTVSLGYLAKFMGWDMGEGWHSADADSEASYEAFKRLIQRAADHENSGKPVRRDLFAPGGAIKEHQERLDDYERQKRGWDYKVKKYKEAQASQPAETPGDGFASRGSTDAPARRASNPARWDQLSPEERQEAINNSAADAFDLLNELAEKGYDAEKLRGLSRLELQKVLDELAPNGEARVSEYVTGDGQAMIEVSNASMGKVFMSLGFHVDVISDDPNQHHILKNSLKDMQDALKAYVEAAKSDPAILRNHPVFVSWAKKNDIDIDSLSGKALGKAAKKFALSYEINLCLYYKEASNMFCGENIGIARTEMPQIGGSMKGNNTVAYNAVITGRIQAKEFQLSEEALKSLTPEEQEAVKKLSLDVARVAKLAREDDPLVKKMFSVVDWNGSEVTIEPVMDRAAAALGITVEKPRFVDPATMLGAQNELQASKVEGMADGAVKEVLIAVEVLKQRGEALTPENISRYLAYEYINPKTGLPGSGLFAPTLTGGRPGSQIYMLDGHHRWAGLMMANEKLEEMGLPYRVMLNIKNYQTDVRSGLEIGRAIQVEMGLADASLTGRADFELDADAIIKSPDEVDALIAAIVDKANVIKKVKEVRDAGKFRDTEDFDTPGGQAGRIQPRKVPIDAVLDEVTGKPIDLIPNSVVKGAKAQRFGYRAGGSGSGWQSVEDHIKLETERGNPLFDTYKEYIDKGYETAWVTHTPGEAGRYVVSAGDVGAWEAGEVEVNPADIAELDLAASTLVGTDGEGGYLYVRKKRGPRLEQRIKELDEEEEMLDGFASMGSDDPFESVALDVVAGAEVPEASVRRGGPKQRDREIVADDFDTRQRQRIAGVQIPERQLDEFGIPMAGNPIYREDIRIGRKKYTFEVDADGVVSVYTGRKYKQVAQLTLDRNHTHIGGRKPNRERHHIEGVSVEKKHRRKGIATQMAEIAEHVYGGRVEHSSSLTKLGRKWRDADMERRNAPGNEPNDKFFGEGFASSPTPDVGLPTFEQDVLAGYGTSNQQAVMMAGIDPAKIKTVMEKVSGRVDKHVSKYAADEDTQETVRHGLKLLGVIGQIWGQHKLGPVFDVAEMLSDDDTGLMGFANTVVKASIHEALVAHGEHYAKLLATELAAVGILTRQKAKEMIEEIRQRMEQSGEYIGAMSREAWNRLRGAWAKMRPTAPIAVPSSTKQWIVSGSSPMWAELSWVDYQTKSRITQRLEPSDTRQWGQIASKVGPSPELIDIATYRAGLGYGIKRIKPRDVVRVYL